MVRASLQNHLQELGLPRQVVDEMLALYRPRHVRSKDAFARVGETDDRLGFVVSGVFSMEAVQQDGRLFIKDFMGPGSFLLGAFEPGQENLVSIRALKNSLLLEARYSAVRALEEKYPLLGVLARRGMERRFQAIGTRLEQLAGMDATNRYRMFQAEFAHLEKDIALHQVAAYLNITPTQLSRIRKERRRPLNLG